MATIKRSEGDRITRVLVSITYHISISIVYEERNGGEKGGIEITVLLSFVLLFIMRLD